MVCFNGVCDVMYHPVYLMEISVRQLQSTLETSFADLVSLCSTMNVNSYYFPLNLCGNFWRRSLFHRISNHLLDDFSLYLILRVRVSSFSLKYVSMHTHTSTLIFSCSLLLSLAPKKVKFLCF